MHPGVSNSRTRDNPDLALLTAVQFEATAAVHNPLPISSVCHQGNFFLVGLGSYNIPGLFTLKGLPALSVSRCQLANRSLRLTDGMIIG